MIKKMYRAAPLALALGTLLASEAAFAAEGGLPQLDTSTYPSQLVWLAITFSIFYLIMSKKALPKVAEVLEQRANQITGDLEKAQQLKAEADQVVAEYEKSLLTARENAKKIIGDMSTAAAESRVAKEQEFATKVASETLAAQEKINAARAKALAEVQAVAAELTVEITDKVAAITANADEAKAVLEKQA